MICPNCGKNISYLSQMNVGSGESLEKGFHCKNCNADLVVEKNEGIKTRLNILVSTFSLAVMIVAYIFGVQSVFVLAMGITFIVFLLAYIVWLDKRIKFRVRNIGDLSQPLKAEESDPSMLQMRQEIKAVFPEQNNPDSKTNQDEYERKLGKKFMFIAALSFVLLSFYGLFYRGNAEMATLSFFLLLPLAIWGFSIWYFRGRKGNLFFGLLAAILVGVAVAAIFSYRDSKKMDEMIEDSLMSTRILDNK